MQHFSLDGTWSVRQVETVEEIPAQVPGVIHLDLLAAGKIPDPYYRDNENALQWISEVGWIYHRTFTLTEEFIAREHILLRCDGLDTLATIRLNGVSVAHTDNMFRTWIFDIKPLCMPGENQLEVQFDPVPTYIAQFELNRALPELAGMCELKGRGWLRKEPCNFGWDWAPVLITCGIWRSISLLAYDTARLTDLQVQQDHTNPDQVKLQVTATVDAVSSDLLHAAFRVEFQGTALSSTTVEMNGTQATVSLVAIFVPPKYLTLRDPQLSLQIAQESDTQFLVSMHAKAPALWSWLTTEIMEARYSDNFLHVCPGKPEQIHVTVADATTLDAFTGDVRVYSLFETYRPL